MLAAKFATKKMDLSWILIGLISTFVAASILHWLTKTSRRLPPGPKGVPVLGHLHLLGKNPHHDLYKIAREHGPIMYMRFGLVPNIIVSTAQAAELFLKTHDHVFAGRPPHQAAKYLSWNQKNMSYASYGTYWRNMRKLCALELFNSSRITSFQPMREQELSLFIESVNEAAKERIAVDLSGKVSSLVADMSCRMIFGKKYEDKDIHERGFKGAIQEGMRLAAYPNLGDYFPFLGILDLQGLTRKLKAVSKVYDGFLEKVIDDHVGIADEGQTKGFVDTLLSIMESPGESGLRLDRGHVKANMLDLLAASMDTSASTIEWVMSELIKNPRIMEKVQKELDQVVGMERHVEESDLDKLEYLYMVVKEIFRLHPVAPFLLPHYATKACTVDGYHIPKDSRIIINTYAIGRDPNMWSEPEKFIPERFVGSDIDIWGNHFQLIPFGSGRRGCPGTQIGLIQVQLIVAQLVHCFDWKLPNDMNPDELDMTEEFSTAVSRANHLVVVPTYRLHI